MGSKNGGDDRAATLGWVAILFPLGLGFVFAVVLAYQAFDAGRSHRLTARAAVREHAQFAAFLVASDVDRRMRESILYGFYPIDLAIGRLDAGTADVGSAQLPPPAALRVQPESTRCAPNMPGESRTFFRYEPQRGDVQTDGPSAEAVEAWVRSELAGDPLLAGARDSAAASFAHRVATLNGEQRIMVFKEWEVLGRTVVYGFESCWRSNGANVFQAAMTDTQALPPSLVGDTPNDSLFTLAAQFQDGTLVHGSEWSRPYAGFYGTAALPAATAFGDMQIRVTLLDDVAERLVRGGLPRTRLPMALGLVALTGLLMGLAVRQLRREHELVTLRSRFVRNVSHELRTPLQQVLLFTELLRSGRLSNAAERQEALDVMYVETRRLIEMVRNVLRFSTPGNGDLRPVDVDLVTLAEETVNAFRPLAASRGTQLEVEALGRPHASADPDAIKRILINLLDNAVKYGPERQTVRVSVDSDTQTARVIVMDQGPGIPVRSRESIWEPFGRLERDEEGPRAGSGIGLSIVRRLTEAMGGTVEVRAGDYGGAAFVVRLPLHPGNSSRPEEAHSHMAAG